MNRLVTGYLSFLSRRRWSARLLVALAGLVVVGLLDYWTGPGLSLSILYLLPIAQETWLDGKRTGLALSALATVSWLVANYPPVELVELLPYWNAVVRLGFFAIVTVVLGELHEAWRRVSDLSRTDALTGLLNVRGFYERGQTEVERCRRSGAPLTILFFDLDKFKEVNDSRGHQEGDRLLEAVARAIRESLRSTDLAARLGGDEFALVLPDTPTSAAEHVVEKMARRFGDAARTEGWPVTLSVGWATWENGTLGSVEEGLGRVDERMYAAKRAGRNHQVGGPAGEPAASGSLDR